MQNENMNPVDPTILPSAPAHGEQRWENRVTQGDIEKITQSIRELGETHKRCQDANSSVLDVHNRTLASLTEMIQKINERDQLRGTAIDSLVAANRELLDIAQGFMRRIETLEKAHDQRVSLHQLR